MRALLIYLAWIKYDIITNRLTSTIAEIKRKASHWNIIICDCMCVCVCALAVKKLSGMNRYIHAFPLLTCQKCKSFQLKKALVKACERYFYDYHALCSSRNNFQCHTFRVRLKRSFEGDIIIWDEETYFSNLKFLHSHATYCTFNYKRDKAHKR